MVILPGVFLSAGVLLAGNGISSLVQFVRSDFHAYQADSSVPVSKGGFALYAGDGTAGVPCAAQRPGPTDTPRGLGGCGSNLACVNLDDKSP